MDNSGYTVVNINGEQIGLHFGVPANRMFYERLAKDEFMVSNDTVNEIGIATIIHCGYVNNCMIKDLPQTKTFGFFLAYVEMGFVDEGIKESLQKIAKVFADSRYTKKLTEQIDNYTEEVKKKIQQIGI